MVKTMTSKLRCFVLAALFTAALPAQSVNAQGQWSIQSGGDPSALLDCFEAAGKTVISAHRGGPTPGLPENSIEAMDALLFAAPAIMEIDVAASKDGVLHLMHDDRLDRTTSGAGRSDQMDWAEIEKLHLKDAAGWATPYRVPSLRDALQWARGKTMLQIDFKRSAKIADVIEIIDEEAMVGDVILIAYSLDDAVEIHRLAPTALISLSIDGPSDLDGAVNAGLPADRVVAFTGTRMLRPELYGALDKRDVEVIFGTLGGAGSIDNILSRKGMDAWYAQMGRDGVDIIATDRPRAVAKVLEEAKRLPENGQCQVNFNAVKTKSE